MSIASHSRGALRRTASSQRAAAVLNVVDKIVDQVDARAPPTMGSMEHSPLDDMIARGPKNPDCYTFGGDEGCLSPRSVSDRSDSSAVQGRAPIPDGPIYSQFQREVTSVEGTAGASPVSARDCRSMSPQRDVAHLTGCASPRMSMLGLDNEPADFKLEEARQSNRLVHRALAAVQVLAPVPVCALCVSYAFFARNA